MPTPSPRFEEHQPTLQTSCHRGDPTHLIMTVADKLENHQASKDPNKRGLVPCLKQHVNVGHSYLKLNCVNLKLIIESIPLMQVSAQAQKISRLDISSKGIPFQDSVCSQVFVFPEALSNEHE